MSTWYVAGRLVTSGEVGGVDCGFAKPMVGVLPVFETREAADEYADGAGVFTIQPVEITER